jgi:DNA gyrase inhibitor GyrI
MAEKRSHTGVLAAIVLSVSTSMARATEEPRYEVVREYGGFEVRDYAPFVVAQVVVPGPVEAAGNRGFRVLASYIFGENDGAQKISMTAPVIQTAAEGAYLVQFTMPRAYSLETLPAPRDPRVEFRKLPGGRFAVIRYSGSWSEDNYRAHLEQLERDVRSAGLRTTGAPIYARYNAPYVPSFMRRNEIWLELE